MPLPNYRNPHGGVRRSPCPDRPGLTLVELLVVVIILTTIVAAALPVMAPSSQTRRLREAARSLNTAVNVAQTRATELGRPYGIWLEKQSQQSGNAADRGAVMTVYFCQEPLPFGGYSEQSRLILTSSGTPGRFVAVFGRHDTIVGRFLPEPLPPSMLRPGDQVIIDNAPYVLTSPQGQFNQVDGNAFLTSTDRYLVQYIGTPGPFVNLAYRPVPEIGGFSGTDWTHPRPFVVRRVPQKVDDPLQLPAGIAIDLEASGDRTGFYHDPLRTDQLGGKLTNDTSVAILFSPGGAVHSIFRNVGGDGTTPGLPPPQVVSYRGDGTVFLMLAKRELVGESQNDPAKASWLDLESLWVGIAPQTGRVVSEENAAVDIVSITEQGYEKTVEERLLSRAFAQKSHNMGGR